jgi:EAL and modified HD-GYP domain-containing signal transduction protein
MLRRLLARWGRRAPDRARNGEKTEAKRQAGPSARPGVASGATVARPPGVAPAQPWRLIARRPLLDRRGAIAGWDLRISPWAAARLRRMQAQRAMQDTLDFAFVQAAQAVMRSPRSVVLNLPAATLRHHTALAQLPPGAIVALDAPTLDALGTEAPVALSILREHDLQIALAPQIALVDPPPEFVVIDAAAGARGASNGAAPQMNPTRGRIVTNLLSFEDVAAALQGGADYACGAYAHAASQRTGQASVQTMAIANILSALTAGRPPREIAELFKADVTLSYRLMRIVGSAAYGMGRSIGSLQEAVIMLGARELHRWLAVLLLASAGGVPLARALHETALARGRLLELVAIARGRTDPPEALFVTGAFSLLDLLLNVPLESALALMPLLPTPTIDALIAESGPWRPYLDLALALEAGDDARQEAACAKLELNRDKAALLYSEAADWAAGAARLGDEV